MKVKFREIINVGIIEASLNIDPHDFLNCDTLEDLEYDLKEYYYGNPQGEYDLGDVRVEDSDLRCNIPTAFIEEWKKLKANGNSE